jgi:hypothetical protein
MDTDPTLIAGAAILIVLVPFLAVAVIGRLVRGSRPVQSETKVPMWKVTSILLGLCTFLILAVVHPLSAAVLAVAALALGFVELELLPKEKKEELARNLHEHQKRWWVRGLNMALLGMCAYFFAVTVWRLAAGSS